MGISRVQKQLKKQLTRQLAKLPKFRQKQVIGLAVAAGLVVGAFQYQPDKYSLRGKVHKVIDGDTLIFKSGGQRHTIRLASIDAPETGSPGRKEQPYGNEAKEGLKELVDQKHLTLSCYERDHYGRDICDVPTSDGGSTANRELVKLGLAWANQEKKGIFLRDQSLLELEEQARKNKRGLWSSPDSIQPWQWRYDCWQKKICD